MITIEAEVTPAAEQSKAATKAERRARGANSAPKKGKSTKKAKATKKAPKGDKTRTTRDGSKTAKVLDLLKRPEGATTKELLKATGWQPHSLRGFLSGTVAKKMGLALTSTKGDDGQRSYSIKP